MWLEILGGKICNAIDTFKLGNFLIKFWKWLIEKLAGKIICGLSVTMIVLSCVNKFAYDVDLNEYISGIITGLISIGVTVGFVKILFDKRNEKESEHLEKEAIKRADLVSQPF